MANSSFAISGSIIANSAKFNNLQVNGTGVSLVGHTHTTSNISGLNATASELNYLQGVTPGTGIGNKAVVLDMFGSLSVPLLLKSYGAEADYGVFNLGLTVNDIPVSVSGHSHTTSDITNFNSSVSGLLPVTNITAGTNISISSNAGNFTINSTAAGGGASISNSGVNRVLTNDGSTSGIIGQSNMTFDGSLLNVTGSGNFASGLFVGGVPLGEVIDDEVAGLLVAGSGINLNYNDIGNTLTVDTNVSTSLVGGTGINLVYNITTDELSINTSGVSLVGHAHGNIDFNGAIGVSSNLPLITTTNGVISTGNFGNTANTFCQGNDSRLSDTRTPTDNTVTTAKIVNSNVTYAKIQNVSATDRLLGRSTAGAGVIEEINCTAFGRSILDDADSAAARTTLDLGTMATASTSNYLAIAGGTLTGAVQVVAGTATAPGVSISGDTNTGIAQIGGADTIGVVTNGVERLRVLSDGSLTSVIPGGSTLLPGFACRAWVNFDGTASPISIRAAGNVTSITDNGTGDYTINFTTAMPDANFCVLGTWGTGANSTNVLTVTRPGTVTASSVRISTNYAVAGSTFISDGGYMYVAIIR